ncbi:apolipoprotein L3-like [Etheostoma spectabile]|uniref:apolipoprotein L3-like n=1 Tax=Etheostoma spectabile TaxID=54343 RepID=UPI0013AF2BCB|nr:apolipoprotein L3-like [Etheostoma spectabile]
MLNKDPQPRPTASEILGRPFIQNCVSKKCKTTVEELQTKLDKLREVADNLERVHVGTTIASLTGGVIGAIGGITSIVGLVLSPLTFGASLIVTGVGVGVGAVGGVTAGVSNITNMVNQSSDRNAIRSFTKEFEQKFNAVATWHQEISYSLQSTMSESADITDNKDSELNENNTLQLGQGLSCISEAVRLGRTVAIGRTAAQTSRVVRLAEVATGVLSGSFVAVDVFFIAMDAKELHHIRQAKTAEEKGGNVSDKSETQDQPSQNTTSIRSEIMKFVHSIRQAADKLQKILDELKSSILLSLSLEDDSELEWQNMESM